MVPSPLRLLRILVPAFVMLCGPAAAEWQPTQTVRIIVPQPPGGLIDTTARLIQPHLERALKHPVIIDNRSGAAGIVGTDAVAKAAPDGHTLLAVAGSLTVLPAVNQRLPYDTVRDLAPVGLISKYAFLFVVNSQQVPAKTLPEFIALAKKEPGRFNYATTGQASLNHLVIEHLVHRSGIQLQHVPYRGGANATLAVVKGEAHLTAISPAVSGPHVEAGALRAIATGGLVRDKQFPNAATVEESGFPGFEAISWVALLAPGGTPKQVIDRLNAELNRALQDPDTAAKIANQGSEVGGGTAAELQRIIASEIRNWTDVARAAKITAQ
jgi:tripartite-type tricarboxylate transporter receptor subunit TctC